MNPSDSATVRKSLRIQLRRRRQQLSTAEQRQAALRLYHLLIHQALFLRARRIGFYFASDGELDPMPLLAASLRMGKRCYLPVLSRHAPQRVSFAPFADGDALSINRWGIPEPVTSVRHLLSPRALDLVLVPLVGFDESGARLGMGKGFYDRTFSYKARLGFTRPRLLGLAHECQKVERIPMEAWDVPLNAVASDRRIYWPG
ncbi:MAG: hypothetical protein RLZZ385_2175 [Pseudomonadota bacterium]|jgi:5-formyltetrahydrofolate cyclo-ligase